MTTPRILRLLAGDYSFGCAGEHSGKGTKDCPFKLHHHHDEFCKYPTIEELFSADINPSEFRARSRR